MTALRKEAGDPPNRLCLNLKTSIYRVLEESHSDDHPLSFFDRRVCFVLYSTIIVFIVLNLLLFYYIHLILIIIKIYTLRFYFLITYCQA